MARILAVALLAGVGALVFAGPKPAPGPGAPDLLFFSVKVATRLHHSCAGCHSDAEIAGRYLLVPLDDLDFPARTILLDNFRATIAFLDPVQPERSELLRKALGEMSHGGGALFRSAGSREFQVLSDLAHGATARNLPPDAITEENARVKTGDTLQLDGSLSSDRNDETLSFRWSVVSRPEGSRAELTAADEEVASIRPDLPGLYRVALRVHDGKLWGAPSTMTISATGAAVLAPRTLGGEMGGKMGGMDGGMMGGSRDQPGSRERVEPRAPSGPSGSEMGTPVRIERRAGERPFHEQRIDDRRLRVLRRLAYDLLSRSARMTEIEAWYTLDHGTLVDRLLVSEEMWNSWYERQMFYFLLLDRFRPKEGRLTTIATRLAKDEITVPRALAEIVRSQYFSDRNPGNDTFVTVVLEQCLGMTVQERKNLRVLEAGKKMYDGYKAKMFKEMGDSQADFVRIVFGQEGFYEHFLRRSYEDLHGTPIDEASLERDRDRLMADPGAMKAILARWLKASAYLDSAKVPRTKPEMTYVRALFVDTIGRPPTYMELRNVRNALLSMGDPTPMRLVMGRVLMDSGQGAVPLSAMDPDRFVFEQFVRLLARTPTDQEKMTFVTALEKDPQVTPNVVLWTLISSPEYQTY